MSLPQRPTPPPPPPAKPVPVWLRRSLENEQRLLGVKR
jgi:hypothetical protein